MKFRIENCSASSAIELYTFNRRIIISQYAGGMSFQHPMKPDQARYLAACLQAAAEKVEGKATTVQHLPADDTEGGEA